MVGEAKLVVVVIDLLYVGLVWYVVRVLEGRLRLSIILFSRLEYCLARHVNMMEHAPTQFQPRYAVTMVPRIVNNVGRFSRVPRLSTLRVRFRRIVQSFVSGTELFALGNARSNGGIVAVIR